MKLFLVKMYWLQKGKSVFYAADLSLSLSWLESTWREHRWLWLWDIRNVLYWTASLTSDRNFFLRNKMTNMLFCLHSRDSTTWFSAEIANVHACTDMIINTWMLYILGNAAGFWNIMSRDNTHRLLNYIESKIKLLLRLFKI